MNTSLFKQTFILLTLISFFNYIANKFYFYWTIWWFDMVMHFSAGVSVGMATILVFFIYTKNKDIGISKLITLSLLSILFIGILWEVYELIIGVTALEEGIAYYTDTASDLILDIFGSILGAVYARRLLDK